MACVVPQEGQGIPVADLNRHMEKELSGNADTFTL